MIELKQNRWPDYYHYRIEPLGLRLIQKEENKFVDMLVDFEQIGSKEIILRLKPNPYAVLAFFSISINIIFIFAFIITEYLPDNFSGAIGLLIGSIIPLALWGSKLFKFSKKKIIQGDEYNITFHYKEKQQKEVDYFIKQIKESKSRYLLEKYTNIDDYTDYYTLKSQFMWLKSNNVINELELQELLKKIERRKIIDGL